MKGIAQSQNFYEMKVTSTILFALLEGKTDITW